MSGNSGQKDSQFGHANSFDLSSVSSFGSTKDSYQAKYEEAYNEKRKLEQKLAGYRTVAKQLPKCQEAISQLKEKDISNTKTIEQLQREKADKDKEIEDLRKLLQQQNQVQREGQGISELPHAGSSRSSAPTSGSSQSFVVLDKPSSPRGGESYLQESTKLNTESYSRSMIKQNVQEQHQPHKVSQQLRVDTQNGQFTSPKSDLRTSQGRSDSTRLTEASNPVLHRGNSTPHSHHNTLKSPEDRRIISYPTALGGPVSVFAIGGSRKPYWQMEQETREAKAAETAAWAASAAATTGKGNLPEHPHTNTFNISTIPHSNQTFIADFDPMMEDFHNTGARPKEWKPLNTNKKPSEPVPSVPQSLAGASIKTPETSGFELLTPPGDELSTWSSPRPDLNDLSEKQRTASSHSQPLVDVTMSEDLIKFPSMTGTAGTPQTQQNIQVAPSQPLYSQQHSGVAFPSDDPSPSQLANQAESMAAALQGGDNLTGMSETLFKFAKEAQEMETRLQQCQALIQRQQVQIQSYAKHNQSGEVQRLSEEVKTLREENATLMDFITTQKEGLAGESEWVTVLKNQSSTDPVRAHYPDSPIMKKMESLEKINARLFLANKDWHNKWEILRQQNQAEKEELQSRVNALTTEQEKLREEIAALDKQLQEASNSKQECLKKAFNLEEEKLKQQHTIETLKTENNNLARSVRRLENEMKTLKSSGRSQDRGHSTSRDLETEVSLLKQQVSIFADDFQKERQDRTAAESKAEKLRIEKDQLKHSSDSKLRKMSMQLKTHEDELRMKARQNAELQYKVDDLKLKLQSEQRKAAMASQQNFSFQPPPSTMQGPRSRIFTTGGQDRCHSGPVYGSQGNIIFPGNQPSFVAVSHSLTSPEHLPGAWQCRSCTYINFPNRTVCDICGSLHNADDESMNGNDTAAARQELHSRGNGAKVRGTDVEDVVVDTP